MSATGMVRARVTIRPLLTAEEMDKAVEKWPPSHSARTIDIPSIVLKLWEQPGGFLLSSVYRRAPNQAAKCGVGQLVMTCRPGGRGKPRPVASHRRVGTLMRSAPCLICALG
jgi:hypothetical protein